MADNKRINLLKGRLFTEHYQLQSNNMNFYLIGSLEGFNDLRFPNVEDWQNCMGHAEGLLKQWNPPEMEYIWKKSNRKYSYQKWRNS